jgi:hypothetical protein
MCSKHVLANAVAPFTGEVLPVVLTAAEVALVSVLALRPDRFVLVAVLEAATDVACNQSEIKSVADS